MKKRVHITLAVAMSLLFNAWSAGHAHAYTYLFQNLLEGVRVKVEYSLYIHMFNAYDKTFEANNGNWIEPGGYCTEKHKSVPWMYKIVVTIEKGFDGCNAHQGVPWTINKTWDRDGGGLMYNRVIKINRSGCRASIDIY